MSGDWPFLWVSDVTTTDALVMGADTVERQMIDLEAACAWWVAVHEKLEERLN